MAAVKYVQKSAWYSDTNTTAAEISDATVSWSDLTTAGFSAGDDVLVIVRAALGNSGNANYTRIQWGVGTTYSGRTSDSNSYSSMESSRTDGAGHPYLWMDRRTLVSNENFYVSGWCSAGTSYIGVAVQVIRLSDLTSNDFAYAEATHTGNAPTTYGTTGATITTPQSGDWLIIGTGYWLDDSTTYDWFTALSVNGSDVAEIRSEGEDTENSMVVGTTHYAASLGSGVTCRVRFRTDYASTHDCPESKIFALRLSSFAAHAGGYTTNTVTFSVADTDYEIINVSSAFTLPNYTYNMAALVQATITSTEATKASASYLAATYSTNTIETGSYTCCGNGATDKWPALGMWTTYLASPAGTYNVLANAYSGPDISPTFSCTIQTWAVWSWELPVTTQHVYPTEFDTVEFDPFFVGKLLRPTGFSTQAFGSPTVKTPAKLIPTGLYTGAIGGAKVVTGQYQTPTASSGYSVFIDYGKQQVIQAPSGVFYTGYTAAIPPPPTGGTEYLAAPVGGSTPGVSAVPALVELTSLLWELDQRWFINADTHNPYWELDQAWQIMDDVDLNLFELDQCWSILQATEVTFELDQAWYTGEKHFELGQEWATINGDLGPSLLTLINAARANESPPLTPYKLYNGLGEDVATTHARNMRATGIYAHEDEGFPSGYRTIQDRMWKIQEIPSAMLENIAIFGEPDAWKPVTAQEIFDIWWESPYHKANMLYDFGQGVDEIYFLMGGEIYGEYAEWQPWPEEDMFWFVGVFLDLTPTEQFVSTFDLNMNWTCNAALIETLKSVWSVSAYTRVRRQHEGSYDIRVGAQHEVPYGTSVAAQHEAPVHFTIGKQHDAPYVGTEFIRTQHEAGYLLEQYTGVVQQHESGWSVNLSATFETPYQDNTMVRAALTSEYGDLARLLGQHEAGYTDLALLRTQHQAPYAPMAGVTRQHEGRYTLTHDLLRQNEAPYGDVVEVRTQHEANHDLSTSNPVIAEHRAIWSLVKNVQVYTAPDIYVEY